MLNMIYCEFLKLKRLKFFSTLIGICLVIPSAFLFFENSGKVISWNKYMISEQMKSSFMFMFIFVFVAGYLISREFTDNTAKEIFSYSQSRIKIFISKLIVTIILIFAIYIFKFCITIALGSILPHEQLSINIVLTYLKANLYIIMFQAAIVPSSIFITSLTRNLTGPTIYGIFLWGLDLLALNSSEKISQIMPPCLVMLPTIPLFDKYNSTATVTPSMVTIPTISILSAIITFIIGFVLCIVYYKKVDIA